MASIDGGYMMMSGKLVMRLLACGVDPVKTTGFAALGFLPVLYNWLDAVHVDGLLGIESGIWMIVALWGPCDHCGWNYSLKHYENSIRTLVERIRSVC